MASHGSPSGGLIPGETAERSGVAWFVVRPSVAGGVLGTAHVVRQGYVAYAASTRCISMTADGAVAMTFGLGGPATVLSAAFAVAAPGQGFGAVRIAGAGVAPDNGFGATSAHGSVGRWGDYSNGEFIPGTNRAWLATQYIPNNGDGNESWGNRVFEVATGWAVPARSGNLPAAGTAGRCRIGGDGRVRRAWRARLVADGGGLENR